MSLDAPSPFFSVIIVNYNAGAYLQRAITSLSLQTDRDFELIIIDNASSDNSIDSLNTSGLPQSTIMAETKNHGFARGNNLAVKMARGSWLVFLNPDAEANSAWLSHIRKAICRYPHVKSFASAQLNMDDPAMMDGAGDAYLGLGFAWRGGFGHSTQQMPKEGLCFSPCGAGAVYEKDMYTRHGGFDESFFCYCEDVDFGFRLQLAGEKCIFLPDASILHKGSAISGRHSYFSIYHGTRNRIWTYFKNMPAPLLLLTLPGHLTLSIYLILRHSLIGHSTATIKGHYDGFREAARIRRRGKLHRRQRAVSIRSLVKIMSWNIFQMHHRCVDVRPLPIALNRQADNLRTNCDRSSDT